ncbi:MAG: ImmA/IrrE family metallo-endopeptidase [Kiritimatiellae bacterium]|nr:ImmA/IrrE family metallo-endopeptidase [Kiritimatiellia bacterium]
MTAPVAQATLFPDADGVDEKTTRSLLDHLLTESKLYKTGDAYKALLAFIVKMRNFAPFNAMLIHIQKPGIRFAASARDWADRFGRSPKQDARPLLILRPFGPVALVYDIADTEGRDLPESVLHAFIAKGPVQDSDIGHYLSLMAKESISCRLFDGGAGNAGSIRLDHITHKPKERHFYCMAVNRNHSAAVKFSTIAHELAHLLLGHLGKDARLNIPDRRGRTHDQVEIEAESVAYLICKRNGCDCNSDAYIYGYLKTHTTVDDLEIYQIMRAAGQIEALLGLTAHTRYEKPSSVSQPSLDSTPTQAMLLKEHTHGPLRNDPQCLPPD